MLKLSYYFKFPVMIFVLACFLQVNIVSAEKDQSLEFEIHCFSEPCPWPDEELRAAFLRYWSLRFTGPHSDSWEMEVPYFRFVIHPQRYQAYVQRFYGFDLDRLNISRIKVIDDNLVEIDLHIVYSDEAGKQGDVVRKERWLRLQDQWMHVIRNPNLFPEIS